MTSRKKARQGGFHSYLKASIPSISYSSTTFDLLFQREEQPCARAENAGYRHGILSVPRHGNCVGRLHWGRSGLGPRTQMPGYIPPLADLKWTSSPLLQGHEGTAPTGNRLGLHEGLSLQRNDCVRSLITHSSVLYEAFLIYLTDVPFPPICH